MALLNFFGSKQPKDENVVIPFEENKPQESSVEPEPPKEDEAKEKKHLLTIVWGTGKPIDVIFNFIHKNFEEEGFQDALVNCDVAYRDAKEKIIRNDLEMLFRRIILRYKDDIREVDVQIDNASKGLALSSVARLEALRKTYEEHLAEIYEMCELLKANDPKITTMIESYRRGFLKGIAAATVNFINNNK